MTEKENAEKTGYYTESLYVKIIVIFAFALLFPINIEHEYGWFMGLMHGTFAPYYSIFTLFSDTALCKAPLHTAAYGIWWWIGLAISLYYIVMALVLTIRQIYRRQKIA